MRTREAYVTVTIVALANVLSYADRMLLPALMQPIKAEFALSDTQMGLLTGFAFATLYAVSGIPIAALADRGSRRTILAVCLAFWSVMTAVCGFARSYGQLLVARMAVGIGESGCTPASLSMLSDHFPAHRRASAMAWFGMGASVGITLGMSLGASLGAALGWRGAFLVFCIPGLLLALAVRFILREPVREVSERTESRGSQMEVVKTLLRDNLPYRWALCASIAQGFLMQGVLQWIPAFLMRTHGATLEFAGTWTGLSMGMGLALGTLLGGLLGDRVAKKELAGHQVLCSRMMLILAVGYILVLWLPALPWVVATLFACSTIAGTTLAPSLATLMNVSHPSMRSTAAALNVLAVGLVGVGLAPVVVGGLSDVLETRFDAQALRFSLNIAILACVVGALLHGKAARAMRAQGL